MCCCFTNCATPIISLRFYNLICAANTRFSALKKWPISHFRVGFVFSGSSLLVNELDIFDAFHVGGSCGASPLSISLAARNTSLGECEYVSSRRAVATFDLAADVKYASRARA